MTIIFFSVVKQYASIVSSEYLQYRLLKYFQQMILLKWQIINVNRISLLNYQIFFPTHFIGKAYKFACIFKCTFLAVHIRYMTFNYHFYCEDITFTACNAHVNRMKLWFSDCSIRVKFII